MRRFFAAWLAVMVAGSAAVRGEDFSGVPGVVIDHSAAATKVFIGSPSIAILPDGKYVASHDVFGAGSDSKTTKVFGSKDRGVTWTPLATIDGQYWSTLFVHGGALYVTGTSREYGFVVIRRSEDGGRTWTEPKDKTSGILRADGKFHCAPVPVIVAKGRVWRAMEDAMGPGGWGSHFRAFMMSAAEDADLLKAESWVSTPPVARDPKWLEGKFNGWLEGNAVVTPEGWVADVLRVDDGLGGERAAIVEISGDGREARFDAAKDFVSMPGGAKKFTIRFDPVTKRYWTLSNFILPGSGGGAAGGIRNTLALVSSADLRTWTVLSIVLHHPDREKHAFQYADWQFNGEDMVAAVRTAFDDEGGGAGRGHDANFLTFHRFSGFRKMEMKDSVPYSVATLTFQNEQMAVTGIGAEMGRLADGETAFTNRAYVWEKVPAELRGWRVTRKAGGEQAEIVVKALKAGAIRAATAPEQAGIGLTGWTAENGVTFTYSDRIHTQMQVYRRALKEGETVTLPQGNWAGMVLLLPGP